MALRKDLAAIAITDHDTIEGIAAALSAAEDTALELIPGVELSVNWKGRSVHLLGYCFDTADKELHQGLAWIQEGRQLRNSRILEKLITLGCPVTKEELQQISGPGLVGRPHFARLLIKKGWAGSMEEAFRCYLGAGAKAYVPRRSMDMVKAMAILHEAGGVAVVAHPFTLGYNNSELAAEVAEMATAGLDGLEVFYPKHSRLFTGTLRALADRHQLIMTGGSDYHGSSRSAGTLADGKNVFVSDHLLQALKERVLLIRGVYQEKENNGNYSDC